MRPTSHGCSERTHNHTGTRRVTLSMNEPSFGVVQLALSKTTTAPFASLSRFSRRFFRFTRSKSPASRPSECSSASQISLKCTEAGHTCKPSDSRNCSTSADLPRPSAPSSSTSRPCPCNWRSRDISFSRPTNGSDKFISNQRSARAPLRVFVVAPSPGPPKTMEFAGRCSRAAALPKNQSILTIVHQILCHHNALFCSIRARWRVGDCIWQYARNGRASRS